MKNNWFDNLKPTHFLYDSSRVAFPRDVHLKPQIPFINSLQPPLSLFYGSLPLDLQSIDPSFLCKQMVTYFNSDPGLLLLNSWYTNLCLSTPRNPTFIPKAIETSPSQGAMIEKPNEVEEGVKIVSPKVVKVHQKLYFNSETTLEFHIKQIINFIISNFGRISQKDLDVEKQKYEFDSSLLQVFETLISKYSSTTKTKEEMIKYILRKALKNIRDQVKEGSNKKERHSEKSFCQKYFGSCKQEISKLGVDIEDEDELLKLLLPFKKTSKDKTMNSNFLAKLFSSEEFCNDYANYLSTFDKEADLDNNTKLKKFVLFILNCIKAQKIVSILNYKRVPWLKTWLNNTKNVGFQLMKDKTLSKKKRVKIEELRSEEESNCKMELSSHESTSDSSQV